MDIDSPIVHARKNYLDHTLIDDSSSADPDFRAQLRLSKVPCRLSECPEHDREETLPPTLLHPVFGRFLDDCESIEVSRDENYIGYELASAMSEFFDTKDDRARRFSRVLERYQIRLNLRTRIKESDYMSDASSAANGHRYVIAAFENEMTGGPDDAYARAIAHYLESTKGDAIKHPTSVLPCMILAVFGSYLVFAGATWNLRPVVQILSTPLAFQFHVTDKDNHHAVARHLAALRNAARSLARYYNGEFLEARVDETVPAPRQAFPYKTFYESLQGEGRVRFRYEREVPSKPLLFVGRCVDQDRRVYVQFSRTYSRDAHEYLASVGHAPVLRGFERLPGDWLMAVYDALDGFETLAKRDASTLDALGGALDKLHRAGFVHGDVRAVNVSVSETDPTNVVVDGFHWAGKRGEVRYPASVDFDGVKRPSDKLGFELVLEEHDVFMLDAIRESFLG